MTDMPFKALGFCECFNPNNDFRFVYDFNRAALCVRFIQLPKGVGRTCDVCRFFHKRRNYRGVFTKPNKW